MPAEDTAYPGDSRSLRQQLQEHIRASITSASPSGRTVDDPSRAAQYAVDALLETQDGQDLLRRIVDHAEARRSERLIEISDAPIRCGYCSAVIIGSGCGPLRTLQAAVDEHADKCPGHDA